LNYLLPIISPTLLSAQNNSGSTALHWAVLNSQLPVVQKLVQFPAGAGIELIDIKNNAGRSPLAEAELIAWDEGAKWLVQKMTLDKGEGPNETEGEEAVGDSDMLDSAEATEVEIGDLDG
jgi:uncharacterized protein